MGYEMRGVAYLKDWQRVRALVLYRDGEQCQHCFGFADTVHHKTPVHTGRTAEERKAILLDVNVCEAVCKDCHRLIHEQERTARWAARDKADNPALDAFAHELL